MKRLLLATLTLLAAATGWVATATPAVASACSAGAGVTVVIDTGSAISTRCAPGDPASAMAALQAVATVATPVRFPGAVVCRIDGVPADDPCVQMPPGDAYWAFFTGKPGGAWIYATSGVTSVNPAPGDVIGFRFGSGQTPRIAPPAGAATSTPEPTQPPSTRPAPTTLAPPASGPPTTNATTTRATTTRATTATSKAASKAATAAQTTAAGSVSSSAAASGDASASTVTESATAAPGSGSASQLASPSPEGGAGERDGAAAVPTDRGSPLGVVGAGVVISGLVGTGLLIQHRRRR